MEPPANMEGVVASLEEALDTLENFVPYRKDGIGGEHETWLFKNHLEEVLLNARAIKAQYGV